MTTVADRACWQLTRLCDMVGMLPHEIVKYRQYVRDALGTPGRRSCGGHPANGTFLSDDHTPIEFSVAFRRGTQPEVRVLLEPDPSDHAWSAARDVLATWGREWNFSLDPLEQVTDLVSEARDPFALWLSLVLRPARPPLVKAYVNPFQQDDGLATVREALVRWGFGSSADQLLNSIHGDERAVFLGIDLGCWEVPRVKVYVAHPAATESRLYQAAAVVPGQDPRLVEDLVRLVGHGQPLAGNPVLSCYGFTDRSKHCPSGYTVHLPIRAYVSNDQKARDLAATVLNTHGIPPAELDTAIWAVTDRELSAGVGLVSYLSVAQERGSNPRITTYLSAEAFAVQPPRSHVTTLAPSGFGSV